MCGLRSCAVEGSERDLAAVVGEVVFFLHCQCAQFWKDVC